MMLSAQVNRSMYISPKVGCLISLATITKDPINSYWSWSLASSGRMTMTDVGPLLTDSLPYRDCMISTNHGGGHGSLGSDFGCCNITSCGRVLCLSVFAVAVGCQQRPPLVGPAASAMAAIPWDRFCQPGQSHLYPIGQFSGHKKPPLSLMRLAAP